MRVLEYRRGSPLSIMSELHLLEISVLPCAFIKDVTDGCLGLLKESAKRHNDQQSTTHHTIIHLFKVIGENQLIAVLEGSVENALKQLNDAHGENIRLSCTPLRTYESFADEVLGLDKSLAASSPRKLSSENGCLFWLKFNVEYLGLSLSQLMSVWKKEASALLTMRNRGELELEVFKVIGQREVHLFMHAPSNDFMDDIIFTLPVMKDIGDQVQVRAKTVKCLKL